jgi:glucokinase
MNERSLAVGVDVGGTHVRGGVVGAGGELLASVCRDTPAGDAAAARDMVVDIVRDLSASFPVTAVGIGTAGLVDGDRSTVHFATNVAWRNEPLGAYVAAGSGLPVVVENDANAAAWAEFRYGAARDATGSMAMVTVGTGIGGGFVLNGQLLRGCAGTAAEPGHMVAVPNGRECGCGRVGCLDQYASGGALVRYARAGASVHAGRLAEVPLINGAAVTSAARAADPVAVRAFHQVAHWLARGLADIVYLLDPELIVVGGGVAEAGDVLMTPLVAAYREELGSRGGLPRAAPIRVARLGATAGLVGAAELARLETARQRALA